VAVSMTEFVHRQGGGSRLSAGPRIHHYYFSGCTKRANRSL